MAELDNFPTNGCARAVWNLQNAMRHLRSKRDSELLTGLRKFWNLSPLGDGLCATLVAFSNGSVIAG
jgi:hypothetical protein